MYYCSHAEKTMRSLPRILVTALLASALALAPAAGYAARAEVEELLRLAPPSSEYPNASFIKLIDEVKYVIRRDGSWTTTTRIAAKICSERGRAIANVQLPYNSAFERIKTLHARTIRPDGTVVDVKREDIAEMSPYSTYAMYSSVKTQVLIMPAIEDDCIIDYKWEVSGRESFMPSHFWQVRHYQSDEPTIISRYILEVPANRSFTHISYNTDIAPVVTTSRSGKTKTYAWEGRDFGEIEPEPYMPALSEICPWFEMSSVSSWDEVTAWYRDLMEPQMKSTPEIEHAVGELTKSKETDLDEAKVVFYWVADKIRYVGLEFGASAYEPHSAEEVFDKRYGDCKDQVSLLVVMLRAAGIKAYPALVATSFRGTTSSRIPSPGIFDHAIALAEIGGRRYWMDPAAEVCPFGDLPEADRGREVLVIKEAGGAFIETPEYAAEENGSWQTTTIKLNADGGVTASVVWTAAGSAGLSARTAYKYAKPSSIKKGFEATIASISPDAKLNDFSIENLTLRDEPLKMTYDFEASGWANRTNKFLIFRPSLHQSVLSQTPFSKPERRHDIRFSGVSTNAADTRIELPDGFRAEEMPQSVSLEMDFATYERTYTLEGNVLTVVERLVRQDARVPAARYSEVRKFYEDVIRAQKQQVVLRVAE